MAGRIVRHPEAFSVGGRGQRQPRQHKSDHLAFIRDLPCLCCRGRKGVEAAHLRMHGIEYGKRETGNREKPHDRWTLPLCGIGGPKNCHFKQGRDERRFWQEVGINPFVAALILWGMSGDSDTAEAVISMWRSGSI